MLPDDVASILETHLKVRIAGAGAVGGGCIARSARIDTEDGCFFLKWSRDEAGAAFPAEAAGLRALRLAGSDLVIPKPLLVREADERGPGLLVLEWIESGSVRDGFWEDFGSGLAKLHRYTGERFGFEIDNFIGRLPQRNEWRETWPDFFASMRLEPQARRARDGGRWRDAWTSRFDHLLGRLDDLLPRRPDASMLHGDLWSGNYLVHADGRASLVDPAAYYGHRETDLAMTELFGGFQPAFYAAYRAAWPLEPGYEERRQVYNLYHLINHMNHFGSGYAGRVQGILGRY